MPKRAAKDPLDPDVLFRRPAGKRAEAREAARREMTAPLPSREEADIFTMAGQFLRRKERTRESYRKRGMPVPKSMQHRPLEAPLPLHHQALRVVRGTASTEEQAAFALASGPPREDSTR